MSSIAFEAGFCKTPFAQFHRSFLDDPALPFAKVLPAETVEMIFRKHDALRGGTFYNTAIVLWAFLSQVLSDGKSCSCSAAVSRIAAFFVALGRKPPSPNTGDYCNARNELSLNALHEIALLIAKNTETIAPDEWLWKGKHHAKLVDGFTATMPDTFENQQRFPQHKQKPGCGFPIMRACVVLSLATAMILDAAFSAYKGKETGESAMLRQMLDSFDSDDIAIFDRYCCSYMMLALFGQKGVHVCARVNASRRVDFRKGKRLGKDDRLVTWQRPRRPEWMSEEMYETIPETMTLRQIRYSLAGKGRRTRSVTVVTTLVDVAEYPAEEIAELYGHRWNVELDIRQIKRTLNMDHFRCKSPEMVGREFWTTILGYNLVRKVICEAASFGGVLPRRLSFTRTCAYLLESWTLWAVMGIRRAMLPHLLEHLSGFLVEERPDRFEPRVIKRRLYKYPLMNKPRHVLKNAQTKSLS